MAGTFVSLDGVMESPDQWHFPYFDDRMGQAVDEQMAEADALLLGRVTYEEFASYWPQQGDDTPGAEFMNPAQKYVVSATLQNVDAWQNSTLLDGNDFVAEIERLKAMPGKNINVIGSARLVQLLLRENLLDELRPQAPPIVVGSGKKLLAGDTSRGCRGWRTLTSSIRACST
ncbi:MAG: dihydrofolate reductase family protein [Thermomicrobiales bacterium]|nr:dihydrofolate reductase family protein [Thermomicrobiales bacterium]